MKNFCAAVILTLISVLPAYAGKWSTGTTAPATCTVGDSWTDTNGTTDNRFYTCTSTDTWTLNSNQTAIDAKANKVGSVMSWSEWGDGASFAASSPPVAYNGSLYKCIAPYTKVAGETPDTQTEYFAEVTGVGGGIAHAPSDGNYYASRNGAWASLDGVFAAPLGSDDNYVTDAEKIKIGNLNGTNTGDQTATTTAFTPNGTIAATNTQEAIEEVRNEAGSATLPTATVGQILQADADGVFQPVSEIAGLINDAGDAGDDLLSAEEINSRIATKQDTLGTNAYHPYTAALAGISGNSKYWGTNSSGTVGVFDLPAGGAGTFAFDTFPTYSDSPHTSGIAVNDTHVAVYSGATNGWGLAPLTFSLGATPELYAATLTIADTEATGDTFTLDSIAYDVADSPVSVTDLPTATEAITYTGSNLGNCTGDVTGTANTGPWTITDGAATVDCAVTVAVAEFCDGTDVFCTSWETGTDALNTGATGNEDVFTSSVGTFARVNTTQMQEGSYYIYGQNGAVVETTNGGAGFGNSVTVNGVFRFDAENLNVSSIVEIRDSASYYSVLRLRRGADASTTDNLVPITAAGKFISASEVTVGPTNISLNKGAIYSYIMTYNTITDIARCIVYDYLGTGVFDTGDITASLNFTIDSVKIMSEGYGYVSHDAVKVNP